MKSGLTRIHVDDQEKAPRFHTGDVERDDERMKALGAEFTASATHVTGSTLGPVDDIRNLVHLTRLSWPGQRAGPGGAPDPVGKS